MQFDSAGWQDAARFLDRHCPKVAFFCSTLRAWLRRYIGEVRLLGLVRHRLRLLAFPTRTGDAAPVKPKISRFPSKEHPHMPGSLTTPGRPSARFNAPVRVAFHLCDNVSTRERNFRGSMAGLRVPLSTLRLHPHGCPRMTRGRCRLLILQRNGLSPSIPCRFRRRTTKFMTGSRGRESIGKEIQLRYLDAVLALTPRAVKIFVQLARWPLLH
jgi:hypothetical protein